MTTSRPDTQEGRLVARILHWHRTRSESSSISASSRGNVANVRLAYQAGRPLDIIRLLGDVFEDDDIELHVAVAGLTAQYADLHGSMYGRSFGWSCQHHAKQLAVGRNSFDLRMQTMLEANRADALVHLRSILGQLERSGSLVNFYRLYDDLRKWDSGGSLIQSSWAREYWVGVPEREKEEDQDETDDTTIS